MKHERPLKHYKILFFTLACLSGWFADYYLATETDDWLHDAAVVYQARTTWPHIGIVALDKGVPLNVGRKQALPLYAKAAERLAAVGAKRLFLDARVFKGMEGRMRYALCIEKDGGVQWSEPQCTVDTLEQCTVLPSEAGSAPLRMNEKAITQFSIAPYLNPEAQDFLLYDWDAVMMMPEQGINVSDRLVTRHSPIARWIDLSLDHAIFKLAQSVNPDKTENSLAKIQNDEVCDKDRSCRRIRLSSPLFRLNDQSERLILPLSVLASCDEAVALEMARKLENKAVIFQVTSPQESTDILVTPMTTAIFGPRLMTPGPQYIADEVETLLQQDHPRAPEAWMKYSVFILIALFAVLTGAYLQQVYLWLGGGIIISILITLCFLNPLVQLWPVTSGFLVFLTGACLTTGAHLIIGFRQGRLISRYMPYQIHDLLMSLPSGISFNNHRCQSVVLMSDLAGYTTVTGLLKEPSDVMNLMNDYLSETSIVLQDKYAGWLEAYVGDLICYYWPYSDSENTEKSGKENYLGNALDKVLLTKPDAFHHILSGALELTQLQHHFFSTLSTRYKGKIDAESLEKISNIINAGVGITSGTVVMGNLGPQNKGKGLLKLGILGDPLNLASRIEGLTRFFNTEVIITEELVADAHLSGFKVRHLGSMGVKGRIAPAIIYALGYAEDVRFSKENVQAWEQWLTMIEQGRNDPDCICPDIFQKDKQSILTWVKRDLLNAQGVWVLDQK